MTVMTLHDPRSTFPGLADLPDSPAVPFVNQFQKRGKHLWCLKCDAAARFLPHVCVTQGATPWAA